MTEKQSFLFQCLSKTLILMFHVNCGILLLVQTHIDLFVNSKGNIQTIATIKVSEISSLRNLIAFASATALYEILSYCSINSHRKLSRNLRLIPCNLFTSYCSILWSMPGVGVYHRSTIFDVSFITLE